MYMSPGESSITLIDLPGKFLVFKQVPDDTLRKAGWVSELAVRRCPWLKWLLPRSVRRDGRVGIICGRALGACAGWECGIFLIGTFRDASVRQEYGCADMEMAVGSVSPRGGSARGVHKLTVAVREFMVRCAPTRYDDRIVGHGSVVIGFSVI